MKGRPPAGRLVALFLVLALSFLGVAARLVILKVRDAPEYAALADRQRLREVSLPAERGSIYDRNLHELALSLPAMAVYANPALIEHPGRAAAQLAPILDRSERDLRAALEAPDSFVYLARQVDLEVARRARRLRLGGIGFLDETRRYYPGGDLASQVLGFVGVDGVGLAGLELQYQDLLAGTPGRLVVEQDPTGREIPQAERQDIPPVPGTNLVLTIDKDLQFQAQGALAGAVQANEARGGQVIVMDPRTGEILAMATEPGFDANAFAQAPPEATRNRSVTDVYEPGSVNKVITAAAALEEDAVDLDQPWEVPDRIQVGDKVFNDSHPHPPELMTITDVIAESSNVGTIQIAQRLGKSTLDRYLRAFGFGRPTGVGFPGESSGILLPRDDWWTTSMATIPIGQGIAVTPLQMLSVYATIAAGGTRVPPTLVRGTVDQSGDFLPAPGPERERVVSRRTARLVTGMLARAVDAGTGQEAAIPGYWVAGKTGTARKPLEGALGYSDEYVASFMGFVPARDPQLVVAAILDDPVTVYGGIASAPLFREVVRFALAHLRIAPSGPPLIPPVVPEAGG
jgi:cell division protein FtsI (penicillin-binding protein 3)